MSGASRLCYHAVPRILLNTLPEFLQPSAHSVDADTRTAADDGVADAGSNNHWRPFGEYMCGARININVRQVHRFTPPLPTESDAA